MKTIRQLREILDAGKWVDAHVHTHLCDGSPEMTVQNIGRKAEEVGIDTVVLTPHFHKQVSDETETLYMDSSDEIFPVLREEIRRYEKDGGTVRILLSTEADILSMDGALSLNLSQEAEGALDLVSPTLNYHPLLPLKFVHLTYGLDVNALHDSGAFLTAAKALGGVGSVLETMYQAEANAIRRCPYPAMLGHLFMTHSVHPDRYSCFDAKPEHLPLMRRGIAEILCACVQTGAMIDLTGVHLFPDVTVQEKLRQNGFLVEFQLQVLRECRRLGVPAFAGSDAHGLHEIGGSDAAYYRYLKTRLLDEENHD